MVFLINRIHFNLVNNCITTPKCFKIDRLCVFLLLLYCSANTAIFNLNFFPPSHSWVGFLSGEWLKCNIVEWCWLWLTGEGKSINNVYCQLCVEENHLVLLNSARVLTAKTGLVRHGGTWRAANEAGFISAGCLIASRMFGGLYTTGSQSFSCEGTLNWHKLIWFCRPSDKNFAFSCFITESIWNLWLKESYILSLCYRPPLWEPLI